MAADALRRLWGEMRELGLGVSGDLHRHDSAPSPLQFLRDHVSPNMPCIISPSATAHWPAIARSLWIDDDYLCNTLRSQIVSLHQTPNGRADSLVPLPKSRSESDEDRLCFATPFVQQIPFPEALRMISSPTSSPTAPVAYAQQQNDCFRGEYSALAADVEPHIPWATEAFGCFPEAINLWIGNSLSQTSFHKDHYENLYVVITGEKHFLLLPPTDLHRLYIRSYPAARYIASPESGELILELECPERQVPWCSVDPFPSSREAMLRQMASFPLYFNGPKPLECTIKAGEILYLPSMWFHHVRQTPDCNGTTIAINYWYDMQFDIKYAYFNFLQSFKVVPHHFLCDMSEKQTQADEEANEQSER
ncbi:jmjC domain-containing protein 7 [Phalaenopsis equestris]|uniref:jmjC domain-containing protein 7 n=1 Tax=Phalaenopsis equestris TaxID=78828 RepID=UPI0009E1DFB5|nr:jmjC domain-containing protein 7 [Phalaenopsis equestris]